MTRPDQRQKWNSALPIAAERLLPPATDPSQHHSPAAWGVDLITDLEHRLTQLTDAQPALKGCLL